jgi:hypothetical protein
LISLFIALYFSLTDYKTFLALYIFSFGLDVVDGAVARKLNQSMRVGCTPKKLYELNMACSFSLWRCIGHAFGQVQLPFPVIVSFSLLHDVHSFVYLLFNIGCD